MDFSNFTPVVIPAVQSGWTTQDIWGALKVRFSIGRNSYRVKPGLYKIGNPNDKDEVFVSANYKLSFDILRKNLKGINAWILVLETYGINVWCAAGKGTFGTSELVKQIKENQLHLYVSHKRLIVPQLGAPGITAHKVKSKTGYSVKFGPVRAEDIPDYLNQGRKKSNKQQTVNFNFKDRLILTPVEFVNNLKGMAIASLVFILVSGISNAGFTFNAIKENTIINLVFLFAAYITGTVLSPLALPLLPFKSFGGKGLISGFLISFIALQIISFDSSIYFKLGWILIAGAISSYLTMNFTGSSTYTSLNGVKKEMRIFVPVQLVMAISGLCLLIISNIMIYG